MTILTYIVTAATMIGTIANSLQKRWCFYVWAVTNTFWMIYNMTIGQYAQGLIYCLNLILSVVGLVRRKRKDGQ